MNKQTALLMLLLPVTVAAQRNYWQQQVNFRMDVALNDRDHSLDGFAKVEYINNSPDTIRFIWFHLWPNAFRTDRTAFSDQLLTNGRTDFYFSKDEDRGYMNRLDFRINSQSLKTEDHPQHIDLVKVWLNKPLPPGASVEITTPFHVQLPKNFSRSGHVQQSYQVTQWYPKPAMYDREGWHLMPYLDQGEYYNNFGDYEVKITIPANYVVLAGAELGDKDELQWLKSRSNFQLPPAPKPKPSTRPSKLKVDRVPSAPTTKTLIYRQKQVTDFAWFADKRYCVQSDTVLLPGGKIVQLTVAHLPGNKLWQEQAINFCKNTLRYRSSLLGDYPYNSFSVAEAAMGSPGGMEYPAISGISTTTNAAMLEYLIGHEAGHNWFQAAIASNERRYPWLDEGLNSYYDLRYKQATARYTGQRKLALTDRVLLSNQYHWKKDQPLGTSADSLTQLNYSLISYEKGAAFMQLLERQLGRQQFDTAMRQYVQQWIYKHPTPAQFQSTLEQTTGTKLSTTFSLQQQQGPLQPPKRMRVSLKPPVAWGNDSLRTIALLPAAGFNLYDGVMLGGVISNYTLPSSKFQFLVAPLYATQSKQLTGAARLAYTIFSKKVFDRITVSLSGMKFSTDEFTDTAGTVFRTGVRKLVPSLKFVFKEASPLSTRERFIQWRTFLFEEDRFRFRQDTLGNGDRVTFITTPSSSRYLNQLRLVVRDVRALYPYQAELVAEQARNWMRIAFTGNYHFNYNERQGLDVRLFAGKFLYLGNPTLTERFLTDPYHLNMTGPRGYEDYTYSNYFFGRTNFDGWASQQLMIRDGGFKLGTDLLANKVGKTDNWLLAMNLVSDLPDAINIFNILPVKVPVKAFLDLGTYAEAWSRNAEGSKILYNAGLQVSMLKNIVQVYVPLLYSRVYRDYLESVITEKRFVRSISFSINIQQVSQKQLDKRLPL